MTLRVFSFILFLPVLAFAQRNMSEARPEIRLLLGEKTAKFWTNAEIDSAWVRAVSVVALEAGILIQKQDTITTSAAVDQYSLKSNYFRIRSVWRGQSVNRSPVQIVDDPYSLERSGTTLPAEYVWIHQNRLIVFPVPVGAEKLYLFYYADPTLSPNADTTTTDLPKSLRKAPVWEAASDLINADFKYDQSMAFHQRAMEIVGRYLALVSRQGDKPSEPQK